MKQQGRHVGGAEALDLADEQAVVAGGLARHRAALEPGRGPVQQRQAMQQRYAQQMGYPPRQNPYQQQMQQRQQYQQPAGIRSLMGRLGGRGMPQAQPRMSMDMPETFGRERRYDMPARDYSRIGSAGVAAPPEMVAAPAGPYAPSEWANSWKNGGKV